MEAVIFSSGLGIEKWRVSKNLSEVEMTTLYDKDDFFEDLEEWLDDDDATD